MNGTKRSWIVTPPWLIIGAVVILVPVFVFMAMDTINRQKEQTTRLLIEQGAAIIRSVEAGTRTGIGMRWSGFQLQKLLMETADHADIDYLIVTDTSGMILADSDPLRIGTLYETDLDLGKIAASKKLFWRQVENSQGADTFEVYRSFLPANHSLREFSYPFCDRLGIPKEPPAGPQRFIVFAGLNMAPIEEAHEQDVRHTIWMAVLFLLIGLAGVVSLFMAEGYLSARSSLSRIRAFSDSLVENMPIGLLATDAAGILTACNRTAEDILHLNAGKVIGKRASDVIPEGCSGLFRMQWETEQPIGQEITCTLPEGSTMALESVIASLHEPEGRFIGNIVIFRDMTEIKRLQDEVARSRRLASLGGLAAGVAHEIRNPLSSIKGFASYFREKFADVPSDREAADVMIREVDRMNRVITQLIEFARPLTTNIDSHAIPVVIRHALSLVEKEAAQKGIIMETDIPEGKWEIPIDADRMTQVFLNLYLNAIAAMEKGGTLRVSLSAQDGQAVRISVSDTGIGIPPEDLPRVFDPYFTTRSSGTGLGLAICHKIIEAHHGEISLESEKGKGTTVVVILPTTVERT
jgi:two-component system sensor histidine kinase HydH